ncbi:MAG TPA: hypothetical protein VN366_02075 [Feifaniaceae bacterium]|nr:hypothetical protein [Feifaniaceae bacterium]
MSNRPVFFLCFRIRVRKEKKFGFAFALPLFTLFAYADMLDDFAQLTKLFTPRAAAAAVKTGAQAAAKWSVSVTGSLMEALWELAVRTGPLDIVDADVTDKNGSVLFKLMTR